ncbi:MAG TPA: ERF family protein [Gemmatimonadales bacterium]
MAEHANLAQALAAFQAELPRLGKGNTANAGTYTYKYADLADVSQTVLPLLGKHGLSFSAKPTIDDGKFVLAYSLRHELGDHDDGQYPLPTGAPQQVGSAITYARRYALSAMTGIAPDGDDDGATAPDVPEVVRERTWDPLEQDVLRGGWEAEIAGAKTADEITEIGKAILAQKRSGELSPNTYAHLAKAGGARKGELNGGQG